MAELTEEQRRAVVGITNPRERALMIDFASWTTLKYLNERLAAKAFHDLADNIISSDGNVSALPPGSGRVRALEHLLRARNAALHARWTG